MLTLTLIEGQDKQLVEFETHRRRAFLAAAQIHCGISAAGAGSWNRQLALYQSLDKVAFHLCW